MQVKYILQRCELFKFIQDHFEVATEHEIDDISFKIGNDSLVDIVEIICVEKKIPSNMQIVKGVDVDIPWEKDIKEDELFCQNKQTQIQKDIY